MSQVDRCPNWTGVPSGQVSQVDWWPKQTGEAQFLKKLTWNHLSNRTFKFLLCTYVVALVINWKTNTDLSDVTFQITATWVDWMQLRLLTVWWQDSWHTGPAAALSHGCVCLKLHNTLLPVSCHSGNQPVLVVSLTKIFSLLESRSVSSWPCFDTVLLQGQKGKLNYKLWHCLVTRAEGKVKL